MSQKKMNETKASVRQALLVGLQLPKVSAKELIGSMDELERLVTTLGLKVVGRISQKRSSSRQALVLGEGKLMELAQWTGGSGFVASPVVRKPNKAALKSEDVVDETELDTEFATYPNLDVDEDLNVSEAGLEPDSEPDPATGATSISEIDRLPPDGTPVDVLIFDCDLSPSQLRNLESATGAEVLDRTGVIIEIFSRHARTRTARLQVEIARLNYLAPRLRETGGGADRQGGGLGGKGSGESSQELDRRHIRDRIKELKVELESVAQETHVRRARRLGENAVALVGYTNAGKSSLMRAMTGSEVLVADKLFATLDTTVRPLDPPSVPRVLLSDTVGFINKLPHDLVASFKSTLEEALNADLLLFVVDASDPAFRMQLQVTRDVLSEIGAESMDSLLILNKRDRLNSFDLEALRLEFPEAVFLSTRDKTDLASMRERLLKFFEKDMIETEILVPYQVQGAIGEIRRLMRVVNENYNEKGVTFKVRSRPEDVERLRSRFQIH